MQDHQIQPLLRISEDIRNKELAECRSHALVVARLVKIVTEDNKFEYGTPMRCLDVVEHVFHAHRRMCNNLQAFVQKHGLGLGGERVDEIVCEKLDDLLSENPAPIAEIEARIKAHTAPNKTVVEVLEKELYGDNEKI